MPARDDIELARHLLAALAYRTDKAISGCPDGFGDFDAGTGIRTPAEIVSHMAEVVTYIESVIGETEVERGPRSDWETSIGRFRNALAVADDALASWEQPDPEVVRRLVQGPIADAMTHAGQLAMLRRMAGAPIPAENFFAADISAGSIELLGRGN